MQYFSETKSAQWKISSAMINMQCEQEFLDCAWDQSVNSCVPSHHQEAQASEWVHIKTMMTHAQIIFHTSLSVLLGRTQSPNMPQQYLVQNCNALKSNSTLDRGRYNFFK